MNIRQIKFRPFRAWDTVQKKMYFGSDKPFMYLTSAARKVSIGFDLHYSLYHDRNRSFDKEICFMQFTGLFDSMKFEEINLAGQKLWFDAGLKEEDWTGKAIYEGDIVLAQKDIDEVPYYQEIVFHRGGFCVGERDYVANFYNVRVVGNIYQNPELLQQDTHDTTTR